MQLTANPLRSLAASDPGRYAKYRIDMNAILSLFATLYFLIRDLHVLGMIVSGIWLAILGDWISILFGVLAIPVAYVILNIALGPLLLFLKPSLYFIKKGQIFLFYVFVILRFTYHFAVIIAWCALVFYFFERQATVESMIPVLIWSFGPALSYWEWITQKEVNSGSEASIIITFFSQIGYIMMILLNIITAIAIIDILKIFIVVMLIGMIFQCTFTIREIRPQHIVPISDDPAIE